MLLPLLALALVVAYGQTAMSHELDDRFPARELERSLVLALDNNPELAAEIVGLLEEAPSLPPEAEQSARDYLNGDWPRVLGARDIAGWEFRSSSREADIRPLIQQVLGGEAQEPSGSDPQPHPSGEMHLLQALLASYLDDLRDTFQHFLVSLTPSQRGLGPVECEEQPSAYLKCCPTCCKQCRCAGESDENEKEEPNAAAANTTQSEPSGDWWQRQLELYPHKGAFRDRDFLLGAFLGKVPQRSLWFSARPTYERFVRVLASLGEPISRATYERRPRERALGDRDLLVRLLAHLTRLARRHYLGPERERRQCTQRVLCVAPNGMSCDRRARENKCRECAKCTRWRCPEPLAGSRKKADARVRVALGLDRQAYYATCGRAPEHGKFSLRGRRGRGWRPSHRPRIVNGYDAHYGEFPSFVRVRPMAETPLGCGGVLLSEWHVLTAAHCMLDPQGRPLPFHRPLLHLGEHSLAQPDRYEAKRRLLGICTDPDFALEPQAVHDRSVLRLATRALLNDFTQPACLPGVGGRPLPRTSGEESNCWLVGFGVQAIERNSTGGATGVVLPSVLQKMRVERVSCYPWKITADDATRSCWAPFADSPRRGDACYGDTGGPVLCEDQQGLWTVMGMLSDGTPECGTRPGGGAGPPFLPGVYADVSKLLGGIIDCMAPAAKQRAQVSNVSQ